MENLKTKTISSLFWKLMERGGNANKVSLRCKIVLARLLSPDDFGMLAIIIVFVNIGAAFSSRIEFSTHRQLRDDGERLFYSILDLLFYSCCSVLWNIIICSVIGDFITKPWN